MKKKSIRAWFERQFGKPLNREDRIDRRIYRSLFVGWEALVWFIGLWTYQGVVILFAHFLILIAVIFYYMFLTKGR